MKIFEKMLDRVSRKLVALNKQTNKQTYSCVQNTQRLEVQFTRTSNFYARKWGDLVFNI